ncbi:TetR/AcrR family transcriptional regulator [Pigmentiphaga sp.]|uniref:TetR/AcrR family transcriptional regulator n=1 Tax=Pigmentiphaga sp. TaxID=1977564 RepID=UPI0025FC861E|nr:TetR/AcrR family transcriptional regulator [Pigmentiphaga sp.]MBX6317880.1 CerR family C-terminal domain-containing protein [Pigmentiphaga sp.]
MSLPPAETPDAASTRARILDVAERLFAEHGYNGVSLRTITATAGVNMAAVHYYFRTKEGLLRAIFEARAGRMNEERRALLQACCPADPAARPNVRAVLEAFIGPGMRLGQTEQGAWFNRLSAICSVEPDPAVKNIVFGVHDDVARLFVDLLARACPHLSREELYVRLQCIYGSMMYIRADNGRVARLMPDVKAAPVSEEGVAQTLSRMLDFMAAGLEAPASR